MSRALTILAALSLFFAIAFSALWVRSIFVRETLGFWVPNKTAFFLYSGGGAVSLFYGPPSSAAPHWYFSHRIYQPSPYTPPRLIRWSPDHVAAGDHVVLGLLLIPPLGWWLAWRRKSVVTGFEIKLVGSKKSQRKVSGT